jgi:hypothetical protein
MDVVAVTPLITVVTTPWLAEMVEELMSDVLEETPLIIDVRVLTAEDRLLELRK